MIQTHRGPAGILFLVVLLCYFNSLGNGFVWDDSLYILRNPFVQDTRNLGLLLSPSFYLNPVDVLASSRPVLLASLIVDHLFWGNSAWGFHLTNMLLHACNAIGVYALATAFGAGAWIALPAALLFAVHPVQAEAVNGICFRSDLLSALFGIGALLLYRKTFGTWNRNRSMFAVASALSLGTGLLAKEMALSVPLLVASFEALFAPRKDRVRRWLWVFSSQAVVLSLFAAFWSPRFRYLDSAPSTRARRHIPKTSHAASAPPASVFAPKPRTGISGETSFGSRLLGSLVRSGEAIRLFLWPRFLVADRDPRTPEVLFSPRIVLPFFLWIVLLVLAWKTRTLSPFASLGILWTLFAFLPVSGLVALFNPFAERYLYWISIGPALALGAGFERARSAFGLPDRRLAAAAGAILLLLGLRTAARNRDWRTDESLFFAPSGPVARSPRAHFVRGSLHSRKGRWRSALEEFRTAIELRPEYAEAWLQTGNVLANAGQGAPANAAFARALELSPSQPLFHFAYGQFLSRTPQTDRALAHYRKAVELEPRYLQAWVNLGTLYGRLSKPDSAVESFQRALALAGRDPFPFYSFGLFWEKSGDPRRASELYRAALERSPGFAPARRALGRL